MSLLDTLSLTSGYSGRRSGRSSLHDEHPPPHSPLFSHFWPLSGGDSRCVAADVPQGSWPGGMP